MQMVAAGSLPAFNASGPFHCSLPKEFGGKRDNFEEFASKLRAYLYIVETRYQQFLQFMENNPNRKVPQTDSLDDQGNLKPDLVIQAGQLQWMFVTWCTGSASAMLRRENSSNRFETGRKL